MSTVWFRIKFTLLMLIALSVGVFALPESVVKYLPEPVQEKLSGYSVKLGIDLSGGTSLEYKIDFTKAQARADASKLDADPNNDFDLDKAKVAEGVVKTLKKRIDPDGRKEVQVFYSQRGEDFYVVVELTVDIDTPENRAKLEKVTSLEFKEPVEMAELMVSVQKNIDDITSGEVSFAELSKSISASGDAFLLPEFSFSNEEILQFFGEDGESIWGTSENTVYEKPIMSAEGVQVLFIKSRGQEERTSISSEKTFEEMLGDLGISPVEKTLADFSSANIQVLSSLSEEGISSVLSENGVFYIVQKLPLLPGEVMGKYATVEFSSKEDADAFYIQVEQKESVELVEVMTIENLLFNGAWKETGLGGTQFQVAKVGQDQNGVPVTEITFDTEGGRMFGEITGKLAKNTNPLCGRQGDVFAIFVDGVNISDPCVRERIDGGNAQISFGASTYLEAQKQAQELSESLNSGATPAPVSLVSERKISASLGETAFTQSVAAAAIGFILVAIWMIVFYRFFGFLAIVALGFYAAVFLFILKVMGVFVLTLAGVAGIILSIGMAVDANILIFERIREELKAGNSFENSMKEGFDRAWTSIRDSNTSSLITSFILYALGTSIIQAFAITLAIGIVISMFTAIVFTRYLIWYFTPKKLQENTALLVGEKNGVL